MELVPKRLKDLMAQKDMKNVALAKLVNRNPKTISRWQKEDSEATTLSEGMVLRIAHALNVDVEVLTGDAPMPEQKHGGARPIRSRIGADVSARTRNAFIMIGKHYEITQTQIIELAPLLFTLIAEGSLDHRRGNLEKTECHINAIHEMAYGGYSRLFSQDAAELSDKEIESINNRDVFGERLGQSPNAHGNFHPTGNPFFEYIKVLTTTLTDKAAVDLGDEEDLYASNIPDFTLFLDEWKKLTGGDEKLALKIAKGTVDLGKLPKNLRSDDAREKRVEWLRKEAARVERVEREEAMNFIEQFIKRS